MGGWLPLLLLGFSHAQNGEMDNEVNIVADGNDAEAMEMMEMKYDNRTDRHFTYCFKMREMFHSHGYIKTFPSKNSRFFHFEEMLKRRNAINVQKSASFTFKRSLDADGVMFINPCNHSAIHATYNENNEFIGANIHNLEHCHHPFHFISRDNLPINYELTIQFAFEWADGKQFNKNKKPILRQLGFTKDEIKALSRHEGHSAECHDVSFWEQKRFFKLSEEVHEFHAMKDTDDFEAAAVQLNKMSEDKDGTTWMGPRLIRRVQSELANTESECNSRPQSIYGDFDCNNFNIDMNECRQDWEFCGEVFKTCLKEGEMVVKEWDLTMAKFDQVCPKFAGEEAAYETIKDLVMWISTWDEETITRWSQEAIDNIDQITAFVDDMPFFGNLKEMVNESGMMMTVDFVRVYKLAMNLLPQFISAGCEAANSIDDIAKFTEIVRDPLNFQLLTENTDMFKIWAAEFIPQLVLKMITTSGDVKPVEMISEVLFTVIMPLLEGAKNASGLDIDVEKVVEKITAALVPLFEASEMSGPDDIVQIIMAMLGPLQSLLEPLLGDVDLGEIDFDGILRIVGEMIELFENMGQEEFNFDRFSKIMMNQVLPLFAPLMADIGDFDVNGLVQGMFKIVEEMMELFQNVEEEEFNFDRFAEIIKDDLLPMLAPLMGDIGDFDIDSFVQGMFKSVKEMMELFEDFGGEEFNLARFSEIMMEDVLPIFAPFLGDMGDFDIAGIMEDLLKAIGAMFALSQQNAEISLNNIFELMMGPIMTLLQPLIGDFDLEMIDFDGILFILGEMMTLFDNIETEGFNLEFFSKIIMNDVLPMFAPLLGDLGDFDITATMGGLFQAIGAIMANLDDFNPNSDDFTWDRAVQMIIEQVGGVIEPIISMFFGDDLGDLGPIMEGIFEIVGSIMSLVEQPNFDEMKKIIRNVVNMVRGFMPFTFNEPLWSVIDMMLNEIPDPLMFGMQLEEYVQNLYVYPTDGYSMPEISMDYSVKILEAISGFMTGTIHAVFNLLERTQMFMGTEEFSGDTLVADIENGIKHSVSMMHQLNESQDVGTTAMIIIDEIVRQLDFLTLSMGINMYEMLALYIPMGRIYVNKEFKFVEIMLPEAIATPMRMLVGDDVIRGAVNVVFQIVSEFVGMELNFGVLASWIDSVQFPNLNFLLRLHVVVFMEDLITIDSAIMELFTSLPQADSYVIPTDLIFTKNARQLFHLWGADDFQLIDLDVPDVPEFIRTIFKSDFIQNSKEEVTVENLVDSITYADTILKMYRIKIVAMGFDDELIDGDRTSLYETFQSEELLEFLFMSHENAENFMRSQNGPYRQKTMALFNIDYTTLIEKFDVLYTLESETDMEEAILDVYNYVGRFWTEFNVPVQTGIRMIMDSNWLWQLYNEAYSANNDLLPEDYFMSWVGPDYVYAGEYPEIVQNDSNMQLFSIWGLNLESAAMAYSNTTGFLWWIADMTNEENPTIHVGDIMAAIHMSDTLIEYYRWVMVGYGFNATILTEASELSVSEYLYSLGEAPWGMSWREEILRVDIVFNGYMLHTLTEEQKSLMTELNFDFANLLLLADNFLEYDETKSRLNIISVIQTIVEDMNPNIGLVGLRTALMKADDLWELYKTVVDIPFNEWLINILDSWKDMSADMEWTGMPEDKLTWLLFDLWGDKNIDQAWSDTSAFLNRLSEEWGVSVEDIKMAIMYREWMINMYEARMNAFGFDGSSVYYGADAVFAELGNDKNMTVAMLADPDMDDTLNWLNNLSSDQKLTLTLFNLNVDAMIGILGGAPGPQMAIDFYEYYFETMKPFLPISDVEMMLDPAMFGWIWGAWGDRIDYAEFPMFAIELITANWQLPFDESTHQILDLWGVETIFEDLTPPEDTTAVLNELSQKWGVSVQEVQSAIQYREILLKMYQARMNAYGLSLNLEKEGRSSIVEKIGTDLYAASLAAPKIDDMLDFFNNLSTDQKRTLELFNLDVDAMISILTEGHANSPHTAIAFYNYFTKNVMPSVDQISILDVKQMMDQDFFASLWMKWGARMDFSEFPMFAIEMLEENEG